MKYYMKNEFNTAWPYFVLISIVILIYYPVVNHDFLYQWDDHWVVINPYTTGGFNVSNIYNIFTKFYHGQYSPLNQMNYLIIYSLFGYSSFAFHLANLGWHLLNVLLVFIFLDTFLKSSTRLSTSNNRRIAFFTAFIWGIHPVNVEAVSWLSASKILIYSSFYLLAILSYLKFHKTRSVLCYCSTLILFLCSFLAKEQAVVFSLCILLIDYFQGRDLKDIQLWEEKAPFLLLAIYGGIITILSQGISDKELIYSLPERLFLGCYALFEYLTKCLFPFKLSYLYPFPMLPGESIPLRLWLYPIILVVVVYCIYLLRKNTILFASTFFLIHILVALHIISISRFTVTADRYIYISCISVCFFVIYNFYNKIYNKKRLKKSIMISCIVLYSIYLGIYSNSYTRVWENSNSLKKELRLLLKQRKDSKEIQEVQQLLSKQQYY